MFHIAALMPSSEAFLHSISVNRWLAVRLEFVGSTIIFLAAVLALSALITTGVDAGLVGFVLSYALNTTGALVSIFDVVFHDPLIQSYESELACTIRERC